LIKLLFWPETRVTLASYQSNRQGAEDEKLLRPAPPHHDLADLLSEIRLNIEQPRQATFILNCIV
jgi:hypothetical protein